MNVTMLVGMQSSTGPLLNDRWDETRQILACWTDGGLEDGCQFDGGASVNA